MITEIVREEEQSETPQLLNTHEAYLYLKQWYPWLKKDTFYHRVLRGRRVPHIERKAGSATRYYFEKRVLDELTFSRKDESDVEKHRPHRHSNDLPAFVSSKEELDALVAVHGPFEPIDRFLEALSQYTGHSYQAGAVKQHRRRRTIAFIRYGKRFLYPTEQIPRLRLQPQAAQMRWKNFS